MLIVNADDMGASPSTTDPVVECFTAGVITSASAMVWMLDSERAARIARELDLPVGLHLNFTLPFAGPNVPDDIRARQLGMTAVFGPEARAGDAGGAVADGMLIAAALTDQLQRFHELFGEPTHLDGHHHVHVNPAVVEHLPRTLPIRPPLSTGAKRTFGQAWLLRRFRRPDACLAFERLHPALGGEGLEVLAQARRRTVEVMVHPAQKREREALLSSDWRAALEGLMLGSYRSLA
jgi:chitin disaccharide deacetylase